MKRETKIQGKSPNIFVGHTNYPKVNVGYLLTQKYDHHDEPTFFAKNKFSIPQIVTKRQQLLNSTIKANIKDPNNSLLDSAKLIAKSSNPVDSEIKIKNLKGSFTTDAIAMPFGPSAELQSIQLTENVKINQFVEKLTSDTDVKAKTALEELSKKNIDEHQLTKLLSIGTLGKSPKLVPTKWSITAVDDTIGLNKYEDILDFPQIDFGVRVGQYLGNKYVICFLPGAYSYEFIEIIYPHTKHNSTDEFKIESDYEFTNGRKEYASETAGGYYASRLPIIQYLFSKRKQGRVIVFRCITDDYTTPLGVWVVREGVRESLKHNVKDISEEDVKKVVLHFLKKYDMSQPEKAINQSVLLREEQKSIKSWFT